MNGGAITGTLKHKIAQRLHAQRIRSEGLGGRHCQGGGWSHTADSQIEQIKIFSGVTPKVALVDRGYRGFEPAANTRLLVSQTRKLPRKLKKLLKPFL